MGEIAVRGRQEAFKLIERSGRRRPRRSPAATPTGELKARRFFAGASCVETPELVSRIAPDQRIALVDGADDACDGRFHVLGYGSVSFGDPIDWHLDPIARVRAPLVHWSRLDVLDRTQVGDSKIPWELNRQQWLVWLGQAYRLTGDERYPAAFVRSIRQWLEANPKSQGINWASSLEVALRLISWLWTVFLFEGARGVRDACRGELLDAAVDHAAHVERYLSYYYAPNTHLTGEALGLLYAGLLLPDRRARRWRDLGMRILIEQCERQIAPDGAYCEQSTGYGRYTAEIYLHAMILAARNGLSFPAPVIARVEALLDHLLWLRAPNGSMPQIGDADGGWLLPLARRAPDDLRGVFSTAAAWLGRPDYARAAGGAVAPETLWLLGARGLASFEALDAASPSASPSRLFAHGGTAVMRASWERDAHQLLLDVAPLASFGHAHADLLSIQCAVFGVPYIVDGGTYCYSADQRWRDFFRSTAAHSTLTVDGRGQATPDRPFAWKSRPAARLLRWRSTEAFDHADAEHDGYLSLADPVVHRRRVLFVKPRYWVLVDDLGGAARHRLDLRFQFAPLEVALGPGGWATVRGPDGRGLLVRAWSSAPLDANVQVGVSEPPAGWVSPDYGRREPAPALVYSATATLPLRIVTLLLPVDDPSTGPPAVSGRLGTRGAVSALVFEDASERIEISDELVWPMASSSTMAV